MMQSWARSWESGHIGPQNPPRSSRYRVLSGEKGRISETYKIYRKFDLLAASTVIFSNDGRDVGVRNAA